jgi:hypothetical protein
MLRWILACTFVLVVCVGSAFGARLDDRFIEVMPPFQACSDKTLIDAGDYRSYKADVLKAVTAQGSNKVQVLAPTGIAVNQIQTVPRLSTSDQAQDLDPVTFLRDIGMEVREYMKGAKERVEKIYGCFGQVAFAKPALSPGAVDQPKILRDKYKLTDAQCAKIRADTKTVVRDLQAKARIELALASTRARPAIPSVSYPPPPNVDEAKRAALREKAAKSPSYPPAVDVMYYPKLATVPDNIVPAGIPSLSNAEKQKVEAIVKEFLVKYNANLDRFDSGSKTGPLPLFESFYIYHRLQYMEILQRAPILAYLGFNDWSASQSGKMDKQIFNAAGSLWSNSLYELKRVNTALARAESDLKKGFFDLRTDRQMRSDASWSLIDFLVYQNTIEKQLKAKARRCAVATSLAFHQENSNYRFMIGAGGAIIVGSVALSVFAPPVVLLGFTFTAAESTALLLGPPIGFAFTADSYFNYKRVEQGAFNAVVQKPGETAPVNPDQVVAARKEYEFSILLQPLDFIGTGLIGKFAAFTAARVGLKAEGLSAREINELLVKSQSRDASVAVPARNRINQITRNYIFKIFGREPSAAESRMVETMMARGFSGTTERPSLENIESFAAKMRDVPVNERDAVAMRATAIFEKLDPGKFNDLSRANVVLVVEAASEFGITSVDQLVRTLETWDQGLEALARTYELAAQKARDPALLQNAAFKNGSLEVKQAMAMDAALSDLLERSSKYRAMNESEQAAVRKQMGICGLGS